MAVSIRVCFVQGIPGDCQRLDMNIQLHHQEEKIHKEELLQFIAQFLGIDRRANPMTIVNGSDYVFGDDVCQLSTSILPDDQGELSLEELSNQDGVEEFSIHVAKLPEESRLRVVNVDAVNSLYSYFYHHETRPDQKVDIPSCGR